MYYHGSSFYSNGKNLIHILGLENQQQNICASNVFALVNFFGKKVIVIHPITKTTINMMMFVCQLVNWFIQQTDEENNCLENCVMEAMEHVADA